MTAGFNEDHVATLPGTAKPLASCGVALRPWVPPMVRIDAPPGVTATCETTCCTVTDVPFVTPPPPLAVAEIVAEPFATAVTRPVLLFTVAMAGSLVPQ